jgi:hypothetical protein
LLKGLIAMAMSRSNIFCGAQAFRRLSAADLGGVRVGNRPWPSIVS